jgi:ATP-dependent Clp protease protease subunit
MENRIYTLGAINNESACSVINYIFEINQIDENTKINNRQPIKLIINSPGGDVYEGMGIVDIIKKSITPIWVYVYGHAQSMAFAIVAVGHKRFASVNSTFMYHELSWGTDDSKLKYYKQELKEAERLWMSYDDIILKNTKITKSMLRKIYKESINWYIDSKQALELGIIDEIL